MTDRNYAVEMRAVMDAETGHGPYTSAVVAEQIVEKLTATDSDLLQGWLNEQAVFFIRHAINLRDCSRRSHARVQAGRSVFREASDAAEAGNTGPLTSFLSTVYVIEDGSRVRLAEMSKPELVFVADGYGQRAAESLLQEAFLRALAKKVGSKKVADHFDEDRIAELWRSITSQ